MNDEIRNESNDLSIPRNAAITSGEPGSQDQRPDEQGSTLHRIFFGAEGLRAGWSLLIFCAIFAAVMFSVSTIGHTLHWLPPRPAGNTIGAQFTLLNEAIPLLVLLLATWIMSKIERRPNGVYGLGGSRRLPHLFAGLAWGVACLSLLVFTLLKTGLLVIDSRLLFGSSILRYGAIWFFGFALVALLEEYLTRGYLQYTLTRGFASIYKWIFNTRYSAVLGFWTSAFVFSFLFGFGHGKNPGESPIGMLSAGLIGLVFCFSLWRTGSLWWAVGFHAAWDWAQSFVYGVADSGLMVEHRLLVTHPQGRPLLSGGSTGPEGSIFILAVVTLVVVIIVFTLRRRTGEDYLAYLPASLQPASIATGSHQSSDIV